MRPFRGERVKRPHWWIPQAIEAWFRGERSLPITALSVPFCGQLDELWSAWTAVHPDAVRPADWPPRPISEGERRAAHGFLTRTKPRWYGADAKPRDVGHN